MHWVNNFKVVEKLVFENFLHWKKVIVGVRYDTQLEPTVDGFLCKLDWFEVLFFEWDVSIVWDGIFLRGFSLSFGRFFLVKVGNFFKLLNDIKQRVGADLFTENGFHFN